MKETVYTTLAESKVIQVIHTRAAVGEVRPGDAPRVVHLYHALDGMLLAYYDPYSGSTEASIQSGLTRMCRESVRIDLDSIDHAYPATSGQKETRES